MVRLRARRDQAVRLVEPAGVNLIPTTAGLQSRHRCIDRLDQIAALGEGEGKTFGASKRFGEGLHAALRRLVAFSSGTIDHDRVHVVVEQRFNRRAEGVVGLDVVLAEQVMRGDLVGGADLSGDQIVGDRLQFVGGGEAVFVAAHQQGFVVGLVEAGEIDRLGAVGGVGDAVGGDVDLPLRYADQHSIPRHLLINRRAVDQLADVVEGVVVPADCIAVFVDVVVGGIGIFDGDGDFASTEIGERRRSSPFRFAP